MIIYRQNIDNVYELCKYNGNDMDKYVIHCYEDNEISKIVEKKLDELYKEVEVYYKKCLDDYNKILKENNNFVYDDCNKIIVDGKLYYIDDYNDRVEIDYEEEDEDFDFEYEYELLKEAIKEKQIEI